MPPLRFVLLRPRNAENLGAAARAMTNFGGRDWVWVQPEVILRGPILLAAKTGTEDLHGLVAGDDRWAHIAAGKLLPLDEAPFSIGSREEIQAKLDHMQAVPGKSLTYTVPGLFEQEQYK